MVVGIDVGEFLILLNKCLYIAFETSVYKLDTLWIDEIERCMDHAYFSCNIYLQIFREFSTCFFAFSCLQGELQGYIHHVCFCSMIIDFLIY